MAGTKRHRARRVRGAPGRRGGRLATTLGAALCASALLGDVAGASVQTYWSGVRASGSWYAVPGYWSYWGNEASGPGGVTYYVAMVRSNGSWVSYSQGTGWAYTSNTTSYYVSPQCAQTSAGSVNFWCKGYY